MEKQQQLMIADWQVKQVSVFTQKGLALKEAAEKLVVESPSDLPTAQTLKKQLQALANEIEQERKAIIFPYRDFIKQLDALAAECAVPTEQAKLIVAQKLLAFDEKVEAERRARAEEEKKRLEEQRLQEETARKAREEEEARLRKIEQDKLEAIRQQQELERAKIAQEQDANKKAQQELEAKKLEEEAKLEAARIEIERKKRDMEEQQRQIDLQKAEMDRKEAEAKEAEARAAKDAISKVKGVRHDWTYEIVNEPLVERKFCTPDSKLINAAIKGGLREAPGLRIYQEKRVQ